MPSKLTVRVFHYPSYTPLMELEVDPSDTVGALKAMVEERLAAGEEGMLKTTANKWLLELAVGGNGKKRLVELTDSDDTDTLSITGFVDFCSFFVEGPVTDTIEGMGQALSVISFRIRQTQLQQTAKDTQQLLLLQQLVDAQNKVAENQYYSMKLVADTRVAALVAASKALVATTEPGERAKRVAEEQQAWSAILLQYQQEGLNADTYLKMYPGMPMQALWEALNATRTTGAQTPVSVVRHATCGLERRTLSTEPVFKVDWVAGYGATPLMLAIHAGRYDVVKELLVLGANINTSDEQIHYTPLHYAAVHGHVDIIETLVAKGASKTAKDTSQTTPLDLLMKFGLPKVPIAKRSVILDLLK